MTPESYFLIFLHNELRERPFAQKHPDIEPRNHAIGTLAHFLCGLAGGVNIPEDLVVSCMPHWYECSAFSTALFSE